MREWMKKHWAIVYWMVVFGFLLGCLFLLQSFANAAEIVTLKPGQADTTIRCNDTTYVTACPDGGWNFRCTIFCDTVIYRVEKRLVFGAIARSESFDSLCATLNDPRMSDIADNIYEELDKLVPRYECKKKPLHPLNGMGPGWSIDGIYTCTHSECAPDTTAIECVDDTTALTWQDIVDMGFADSVSHLQTTEAVQLPRYRCKKPFKHNLRDHIKYNYGVTCDHPECAPEPPLDSNFTELIPEPKGLTMTILHNDTAIYIRGLSGDWYKATEELDRLVWLKTDEIKGDRSDACIEINRHEGTTGLYINSPVPELKIRGYNMPLIESKPCKCCGRK